ncbi:MAG: peptidylprolyl isomerase, partial [Minicystis sp.]
RPFDPRRWLRAPALHFAAIGLALFLVHARVQRPPQLPVTVSAAYVDGLVREYTERTGKPPSAEETQALVDRFVDEELLFREALAIGLDRGDPIVRRRLVQKMELVGDGAAPVPEPLENELQIYLDAHADRYREPPRLTFHHVFLSHDRRGDSAVADARALAAQLRAGADPLRVGDPFFQGRAWSQRSEQDIASVFGPAFAAALTTLPAGSWSDPLHSSFGEHLVQIDERTEGRPAPLATVRARVRDEWMTAQREQRRSRALRALRERYRIELEPRAPASPPAQSLAGGTSP